MVGGHSEWSCDVTQILDTRWLFWKCTDARCWCMAVTVSLTSKSAVHLGHFAVCLVFNIDLGLWLLMTASW